MKYIKFLIYHLVILCIIAGACWIEYLCCSNISYSNDVEVNVALIIGAICVPVLTLFLTIDFKTDNIDD